MSSLPVDWTFTLCKCGFLVTTSPGGNHHCPKCYFKEHGYS